MGEQHAAVDALIETWSRLRALGIPDADIRKALAPISSALEKLLASEPPERPRLAVGQVVGSIDNGRRLVRAR